MTDKKYLTFRGAVSALGVIQQQLCFTTRHEENLPTAFYQVDRQSWQLQQWHLPTSSCGFCWHDAQPSPIIILGTDGHVYALNRSSSAVTTHYQLPDADAHQAIAIGAVAQQCVAVLYHDLCCVLSAQGQCLQQFALPAPATQLAVSDDGQLFVIGDQQGCLACYERDEQGVFVLSSREALHQGEVTALCFQPDAPQIYSASLDLKLLVTYARGQLNALDRGKRVNHSQPIRSLSCSGQRLFSGADDALCKAWSLQGGQPNTCKDKIKDIQHLMFLQEADAAFLVCATAQGRLQWIGLDDEHKFTQLDYQVEDGYVWAAQQLQGKNIEQREAGYRWLAHAADQRALEQLHQHILKQERDSQLRQLGVQLLSECPHPHALNCLENQLKHDDQQVRAFAFKGVQSKIAADDLSFVLRCLKNRHRDVVFLAMECLLQLTRKEGIAQKAKSFFAKSDQGQRAQLRQMALHALQELLEHNENLVRLRALDYLEQSYANTDATADLQGLSSRHADVRRAGLIRLWQRDFLQDFQANRQVRFCLDDAELMVSQTACLVHVAQQPLLLAWLRYHDQTLHQQATELEQFGLQSQAVTASVASKATKPKTALQEAHKQPLLQAMASRNQYSCLFGSRALAMLGDQRAFTVLLQLGQHADVSIRKAVCQALAQLGDPNAIQSLRQRLEDSDGVVRDVAFTAVCQLQPDEIEQVAMAFAASQEDVQMRGLTILLKHPAMTDQAHPKRAALLHWLCHVLNHQAKKIRLAAFKAIFNRNIAGDKIATLQLLLQSAFVDIHQEVFNEVEANLKQDWAQDFLLQLFDNPKSSIRLQSFQCGLKFFKNRHVPLERGVLSQHSDVRTQALNELLREPDTQQQALLLQLINDPKPTLRLQALDALISAQQTEALQQALSSEFADVRARAACAAARLGLSTAQPVLLELLHAPEPDTRDNKIHARWVTLTQSALQGIMLLRDSALFEQVQPFLAHEQADIRLAAAKTLPWLSRAQHAKQLKGLLSHGHADVQLQAALALCYLGEADGYGLVASAKASASLQDVERLSAAYRLGKVDIAAWLEMCRGSSMKNAVALLLLLNQWLNEQGEPQQLIAALSCEAPSLQYLAAQALSLLHDTAQMEQWLLSLINQRYKSNRNDANGQMTAEHLHSLMAGLASTDPWVQIDTIQLVVLLSSATWPEWLLAWQQATQRNAAAFATEVQPKPCRIAIEALSDWAFGGYVSLLRTSNQTANTAELRVAVLQAMLRLQQQHPMLQDSVHVALIQALRDPETLVRTTAFELAQQQQVAYLGEEALISGFSDVGDLGLEWLTQQPSRQDQALLQQVMVQHNDSLSMKAAQRLIERIGVIATAHQALVARFQPLRIQAVYWLVQACDSQEADQAKLALQHLVEASRSSDIEVALQAVTRLAVQQHPVALQQLMALLPRVRDRDAVAKLLKALSTLQTPEVGAALIGYLQQTPNPNVPVESIFKRIAAAGQKADAYAVLPWLDHAEWGNDAFVCLRSLAGYSKSISLSRAEQGQLDEVTLNTPRHDDVLCDLVTALVKRSQVKWLGQLNNALSYALSAQVDETLGQLYASVPDVLLMKWVAVASWRMRFRGAHPACQTLLNETLQHRDAMLRFVAAEALAQSQQKQGLATLLAAIEHFDDVELRQRAVYALGALADEQGFDKLLALAQIEQHALQNHAIEAIGHLSASPQQARIFALLQQKLTDSQYQSSEMAAFALRGLRWFNTPASWRCIRAHAANQQLSDYDRAHSVRLLGDFDCVENRDLLMQLLAGRPGYTLRKPVYQSALRLWPVQAEQCSVLDEALLRYQMSHLDDKALQRVCAYGSAAQWLALLDYADRSVVQQLTQTLLAQSKWDEAALLQVLQQGREQARIVAAHCLGRATDLSKTALQQIEAVVQQQWQQWQQAIALADQRVLTQTLQLLKPLLWCCAQHQLALALRIQVVEQAECDIMLRVAVLRDLLRHPQQSELAALYQRLLHSSQQALRMMASQGCIRMGGTVSSSVVTDHFAVQLLGQQGEQPAWLESGLQSTEQQSLLLHYAIRQQNVAQLAAVANQADLDEVLRINAIEALACIAQPEALQQLQQLYQTQQDSLKQVSYRALRRLQRKLNPSNTGATA